MTRITPLRAVPIPTDGGHPALNTDSVRQSPCPITSCPDNYGTLPSCAGLAVPYVPFQQNGSKNIPRARP
ncbi:MAG: hypothetical protein ACLUJG_15765 [Lawsonibacter sp.]